MRGDRVGANGCRDVTVQLQFDLAELTTGDIARLTNWP
jgi:hypothetical protein